MPLEAMCCVRKGLMDDTIDWVRAVGESEVSKARLYGMCLGEVKAEKWIIQLLGGVEPESSDNGTYNAVYREAIVDCLLPSLMYRVSGGLGFSKAKIDSRYHEDTIPPILV